MEELRSAAFPAHKPELRRMEAATTPGGRQKGRRCCYLSPRVVDTGGCGSHSCPVSGAEDMEDRERSGGDILSFCTPFNSQISRPTLADLASESSSLQGQPYNAERNWGLGESQKAEGSYRLSPRPDYYDNQQRKFLKESYFPLLLSLWTIAEIHRLLCLGRQNLEKALEKT